METQKFYSIGEAAKIVGATIETLRYYDRIGLLKPAKVDLESRYRYYTDTELIYLEVIAFYRKNKMPLEEIKQILNADFSDIIPFLQSAENNIETELQRLSKIKEQISFLRQSLQEHVIDDDPDIYIRHFEERAILLANQLHEATLESFRQLHTDLYQRLDSAVKKQFSFDHSANFLIAPRTDSYGTMFAVCTKYSSCPALRFLRAGEYLCCKCTEENRDGMIAALWQIAKKEYHKNPQHIILNVQFIGLFRWQYEIQIPLC